MYFSPSNTFSWHLTIDAPQGKRDIRKSSSSIISNTMREICDILWERSHCLWSPSYLRRSNILSPTSWQQKGRENHKMSRHHSSWLPKSHLTCLELFFRIFIWKVTKYLLCSVDGELLSILTLVSEWGNSRGFAANRINHHHFVNHKGGIDHSGFFIRNLCDHGHSCNSSVYVFPQGASSGKLDCFLLTKVILKILNIAIC